MYIMTYYAGISFTESYKNNSVSITTLGTPQWIPQLVWFAGLVWFFITLIFVSLYAIVSLLQRNWELVNKIAGVPSIADVIEEETQGQDVVLASAETLDKTR